MRALKNVKIKVGSRNLVLQAELSGGAKNVHILNTKLISHAFVARNVDNTFHLELQMAPGGLEQTPLRLVETDEETASKILSLIYDADAAKAAIEAAKER